MRGPVPTDTRPSASGPSVFRVTLVSLLPSPGLVCSDTNLSSSGSRIQAYPTAQSRLSHKRPRLPNETLYHNTRRHPQLEGVKIRCATLKHRLRREVDGGVVKLTETILCTGSCVLFLQTQEVTVGFVFCRHTHLNQSVRL